ncbi:MAG: hypothetical protein ABIK37_05195 [candidate division WOR-3 bacterium]
MRWGTAKKVGTGGSGEGTVTAIAAGVGVVNTPNPITTTGTVRFDTAWFKTWYSGGACAWDTFKVLAGWGVEKTSAGDTVRLAADSATLHTWGNSLWLYDVTLGFGMVDSGQAVTNGTVLRVDTAGWGIGSGGPDANAFHHDDASDSAYNLYAGGVICDDMNTARVMGRNKLQIFGGVSGNADSVVINDSLQICGAEALVLHAGPDRLFLAPGGAIVGTHRKGVTLVSPGSADTTNMTSTGLFSNKGRVVVDSVHARKLVGDGSGVTGVFADSASVADSANVAAVAWTSKDSAWTWAHAESLSGTVTNTTRVRSGQLILPGGAAIDSVTLAGDRIYFWVGGQKFAAINEP